MTKKRTSNKALLAEIKGYLTSLDALRMANTSQAELLKTEREKREFFEKKTAELDGQIDKILKAHAHEVKAYKDVIDFLLVRYHVKDPPRSELVVG